VSFLVIVVTTECGRLILECGSNLVQLETVVSNLLLTHGSDTNFRNIWHTAAAISGATAVGLGAYGAHKFKPSDPKWVVVYQRGSEYHLIHTLLLAGAPLARRPNVVRP